MIVSDAGKPFAIDERPTVSGAAILVEAIDILMEQVRGLQFERLELNAGTDGAAKPVWFSIDSELGQARESDAAFASGRQPHSSKQERRQNLPSEARREDISVLPLYRISLRRQLNVGLTITLPPGNPGDVSSTLGGIVTQMLDTDDLALWYALNRLMTNYWADVDSNGGSQAHEFYLPDALYVVGNNRFEGEQKIRAFYARRRQRGRTTTRHLVDNLRVFRDDVRHARSVGVMSLYRADGNPPFQGARPPAMIADFEAQCVLGDDRLWRFQSHVLRPIFVGSDVPISLTIDPRHL